MSTRKKDGKALLEVIGGGSRRPLGVPGWFGQAKPANAQTPSKPAPVATAQPAAPAGAPAPAAKPTVAPAVTPGPGAAAKAAPAAPAARAVGTAALPRSGARPAGLPGAEPAVYAAGGRLRFSLSQTAAAVTAVVALLVLGGVFWAGRASVRPTAGTMSDRVEQRPEVGNVEKPGRGAPAPGGTNVSPDDAVRLQGYRYLVIESGIMGRRDALEIQQYLHKNTIDATIHQMPHTGMWMVKGLQPFPDAPKMTAASRQQLADHVAQIERLGKEYKRQGGKYLFRQSRDNEPYMILEK